MRNVGIVSFVTDLNDRVVHKQCDKKLEDHLVSGQDSHHLHVATYSLVL
jgi:hypothetical protein